MGAKTQYPKAQTEPLQEVSFKLQEMQIFLTVVAMILCHVRLLAAKIKRFATISARMQYGVVDA